jgi:hypothetical protein
MLANLHRHERDARITFHDPSHTYTIDGSSDGYVSVTSLKKRMWAEFDADLVISKMMRNPKWPKHKLFGKSRSVIKEGWDKTRNDAAAAGTAMHLNIERFLNGEQHESSSKEWRLFTMFQEAHPNLDTYRTEMLVFDESVKVAGSIDLVCRDPAEEGSYLLYDWKRSKCIDTFNTYERGFPNTAAAELDNCNFNHYSLQLSIYKHILQTKYGMKVNGCCLVVLHPEQNDFIEMQTEDMQPLVDELWKIRAEEVAATKENDRITADGVTVTPPNSSANSDAETENSSPHSKRQRLALQTVLMNA